MMVICKHSNTHTVCHRDTVRSPVTYIVIMTHSEALVKQNKKW